MCDLTPKAQAALKTPWNETRQCINGQVRGVSLIESEDSRVKCPEDLRFQERIVVSPMVMSKEESSKFVFMFVFDRRKGSAMEAALNTGRTFFICMLLGVGAMTFSKDANKLVLAPIERMIAKLDKIRASPLAAMSLGEDIVNREQTEALRYQSLLSMRGSTDSEANPSITDELVLNAIKPKSLKDRLQFFWDSCWIKLTCGCYRPQAPSLNDPMETIVLEKTIVKIGSLLALGFGEAGAEIIGQNMGGRPGAELNCMIPGKRVDAIFGYCNIRNFAATTDVLEDEIMVFVNRIVDIVHSIVTEFYGSPNQNVGGAFLLVWCLSGHPSPKRSRLADCAAVSFMQIIAKTSKSAVLARYRSNARLVKRLPGYRVRMGFGLHTGWAIEGAIGSNFKIDASYIGPHVCMASRLEGLTNVYGSSVIISDHLVQLMSPEFAKLCRPIDCVLIHRVSGVALPDWEPIRLYNVDLDEFALEAESDTSAGRNKYETHRDHLKERNRRRQHRVERWADDYNMSDMISRDHDIMKMRDKYSEEFFDKFSSAFTNYQNGNWEEAARQLEQTRFFNIIEDGPSSALLSFMKTCGGQAPTDWRGYRIYEDLRG